MPCSSSTSSVWESTWNVFFKQKLTQGLKPIVPMELGSEGMTTCSGWFSSSLKLGSSILTAMGDSRGRLEGPAFGELRLLGLKGVKLVVVAMVVLTLPAAEVFRLIFLALFFLLVSTLSLSKGFSITDAWGWWSHKPWTWSVSADLRKDWRRPRSTWTWASWKRSLITRASFLHKSLFCS